MFWLVHGLTAVVLLPLSTLVAVAVGRDALGRFSAFIYAWFPALLTVFTPWGLIEDLFLGVRPGSITEGFLLVQLTAVVAAVVAAIRWKPRPIRDSLLRPEVEEIARAHFRSSPQQTDVDTIRAAQQGMTERPPENNSQDRD